MRNKIVSKTHTCTTITYFYFKATSNSYLSSNILCICMHKQYSKAWEAYHISYKYQSSFNPSFHQTKPNQNPSLIFHLFFLYIWLNFLLILIYEIPLMKGVLNDQKTSQQIDKKTVVGLRGSVWQWNFGHEQKKMRGKNLSAKAVFMLCIACFIAGSLFTNRTWMIRSSEINHREGNVPIVKNKHVQAKLEEVKQDCDDHDNKRKLAEGKSSVDVLDQVTKTHAVIHSLDKTISSLEMELAVARTAQTYGANPIEKSSNGTLKKAFVVIGINTAFSSKRRRDSIRETWMPTGDKLKQLEKEKGIVIRFVIGHSATPGGVLDRAIDAEDEENKDFLRLEHVEGYHELSTKTRLYFSTVLRIWDADFYMKIDDDVHVNLGMLAATLARHRSKPRVYIGCMKSGPVLSQRGVKYHEPEFWKFGEEGNKYFRHATGQIYAISKDLAAYISINSPILHRYANEDVSLGAWFIGLEVEHVDDRSMCCGTPPDCEWKAQIGNVCVASFDWTCSGICKSVERMKYVHNACGEGEGAVWNVDHLSVSSSI